MQAFGQWGIRLEKDGLNGGRETDGCSNALGEEGPARKLGLVPAVGCILVIDWGFLEI